MKRFSINTLLIEIYNQKSTQNNYLNQNNPSKLKKLLQKNVLSQN